MLTKTLCTKYASVAACLFALSSCSSGPWNGAKFIGERTVNGKEPVAEVVETFKLETKDAVSGKRRSKPNNI